MPGLLYIVHVPAHALPLHNTTQHSVLLTCMLLVVPCRARAAVHLVQQAVAVAVGAAAATSLVWTPTWTLSWRWRCACH